MTPSERPPVLDSDPDIVGVDPATIRRIRQTVACGDADGLPRVPGAGDVFQVDGRRVQRMFNGLLVEEGCYYGELITPIIRRLRGVHEPQEEVVVHVLMQRLRAEQEAGELAAPFAVELGAFWSYYAMWFCSDLEDAHAVAMEPDPAYLEVGRRNVTLNELADRITFAHGGIGGDPDSTFPFTAESDGITRETPAHDLRSLMDLGGTDHVDILFSDIQGFETRLLELAADDLRAGAVRFVVMSTHHGSISGDPLTHQRALATLEELGAHLIAEHTVAESCSGDGLLVASFDPRDRDLVVPVSHVRSRDSLFGEVEYDVERYRAEAALHRAEIERLTTELGAVRKRVGRQRARNEALRAEIAALRASTTWRLGRLVTGPAARLRRR